MPDVFLMAYWKSKNQDPGLRAWDPYVGSGSRNSSLETRDLRPIGGIRNPEPLGGIWDLGTSTSDPSLVTQNPTWGPHSRNKYVGIK